MAPYILIGLVFASILVSWIITKNKVLVITNFILSILNFLLGVLHMTIFPYLFGHCNGCLSIAIAEGNFKGIDFSRKEKALGTAFDANDVLHISSTIILVIGFIITFILSKKKIDSKFKKWIYNIATLILLVIQFCFLQMCVYG